MKSLPILDSFAGKIKSDWHWRDEDLKAWRLDDALYLKTAVGSIWGPKNTASNLLLRPVTPPISIQVSVEIAPNHGGEQAGLVLWCDDDNYVKLVREQVQVQEVVFAAEYDAEPFVIDTSNCLDVDVILRLSIDAEQVRAWYRKPATPWQELTPHPHRLCLDSLHVGLLVHGSKGDKEARFSDFRMG